MTLIDAVQSLVRRFPNRNFTEATAERYVTDYLADLDDLPEDLVVAAIMRLRKTSTFMPSVAEIREIVVEAVCQLPSEDEAWKAVRKVLNLQESWREHLHPLVYEAAVSIGSWELRHDEKGFATNAFRKLYREKRAETIKDVSAGAIPLPALAAGHSNAAILPLRMLG